MLLVEKIFVLLEANSASQRDLVLVDLLEINTSGQPQNELGSALQTDLNLQLDCT